MSHSLEFTRKIYDETLSWYRSAETKAQILLGVLGTFIVLLSGMLMTKPEDAEKILSGFDTGVWVSLGLAFTSMACALYCCMRCLWSRLHSGNLKQTGSTEVYPPERMFYFGHQAFHQPEKLSVSLLNLDEPTELRIYAYQIVVLSRNVLSKHRWVNRGFVTACASVFLLMAATIFYVLKN